MESSRALNPQQSLNKKVNLSTQQVIQQVTDKGEIVYYLPCYVRFLVKEIKNVDVQSMEALVSGTLLFSFYYGSVPKEYLDRFVGQDAEMAILLEFNQEQPIFLREDKGITRKMDYEQRVVNFVVRQNFRANLKGNVFITPFEVLNICLSVIAQTVHLPHAEGEKNVSFRFNCMDSTEVELISHGDNLSFGYYRIATFYLDAVYSNSRKHPFNDQMCCFSEGTEEGHQDDFFNCFQCAHFKIPIYKYPGISMLTIFIPLWIISLIGIFVFFQEPAFGSRLATIAVLALAFVAFLPTINSTVPQTPNLKLVDILVIMQLAAVVLLLIQSFQNRFSSQTDFDWQNSNLFLAAIALNIFTVLTVLILFVVHKLIWERRYTRKRQAKQKQSRNFSRKVWSNLQCDYEFAKASSQFKLKNI